MNPLELEKKGKSNLPGGVACSRQKRGKRHASTGISREATGGKKG